MHHNYISKQGEPAETAKRAWGRWWEEAERMTEGNDGSGSPFAKDHDGTVWKLIDLFNENDFAMDTEHGLPNGRRALLLCKHCRATNITKAG